MRVRLLLGNFRSLMEAGMDPDRTPCGPSRRQLTDVSLDSNFETRYWMQVLGVTRYQLQQAVEAVGTRVDFVMDYLSVPERRMRDEQMIVRVPLSPSA